MALGGEHGPKSVPNGVRGGRDWSLFLGLEGLGGVLGPLGAQEPISIDFWLIFGDFGRFLEDFWMIFQ